MKFLSLAVAAAFILVGCGGGGEKSSSSNSAPVDSGTVVPPPAPKITNSGSVDAHFIAGARARFLLAGATIQAGSDPTPFTQTSDGAVTVMGKYALTGTQIATQEISGNANYAQGRWNVGTVSLGNGASDSMSGSDNNSYHYVLFNGLAAIPKSGSMTCDAGKFTKPNYVSGATTPSASAYFGNSTGSAAIKFDTQGAQVSAAISLTAGVVSGNANLSTTISSALGNSFFTGGLGGNGAWFTLGDAGNGSVYLIVNYTVGLANGDVYRGLATFTCK